MYTPHSVQFKKNKKTIKRNSRYSSKCQWLTFISATNHLWLSIPVLACNTCSPNNIQKFIFKLVHFLQVLKSIHDKPANSIDFAHNFIRTTGHREFKVTRLCCIAHSRSKTCPIMFNYIECRISHNSFDPCRCTAEYTKPAYGTQTFLLLVDTVFSLCLVLEGKTWNA